MYGNVDWGMSAKTERLLPLRLGTSTARNASQKTQIEQITTELPSARTSRRGAERKGLVDLSSRQNKPRPPKIPRLQTAPESSTCCRDRSRFITSREADTAGALEERAQTDRAFTDIGKALSEHAGNERAWTARSREVDPAVLEAQRLAVARVRTAQVGVRRGGGDDVEGISALLTSQLDGASVGERVSVRYCDGDLLGLAKFSCVKVDMWFENECGSCNRRISLSTCLLVGKSGMRPAAVRKRCKHATLTVMIQPISLKVDGRDLRGLGSENRVVVG